MTAVFVHGVPETAAVWDPLVQELAALGRRHVVRLSPPGFGVPLPDGFGATVGDYRDWLIGELSMFDTPVDLVGHDWGGGHALGVAMSRPDLLRSWVSDVVGAFEPDYVWHDQAQMWQTPSEGERDISALFSGGTADRAARMVRWGIPEPTASAVARGQGAGMSRAVLALYRSTAQPALADIGRGLPAAAARPGLTLIAGEDHLVGSLEQRRRGAVRAGSQVEVLEGLGHWWMLQDPAKGAHVLAAFWDDLQP